jgi:hypothetical protein
MPEGRAIRPLCALVLLGLSAVGLQAQQPSKEYIRLGGRVIAVENQQAISVAVSPPSATISAGGQQQFTATVTGTTNTAVTWSAQGGGTINSTGLYTGPTGISSPVTATVKATSQADSSKWATATVTVNPPLVVTVAVSPPSATISAGGQQQFTATVTGTTNTAVTWSAQGGGTINSTGLYTGPTGISSPITATVRATSQADSSKWATATVTVNPPPLVVTVAVSPPSAQLVDGWEKQITATVTGDGGQGVTWSLSPAGRGTLTANGLTVTYRTPRDVTSPETVNVKATSIADPTKYAIAAITINPSRPPVLVSVSPNSGSGSRKTFTFKMSDPDGYEDIGDMQIIIDWGYTSRCHLFLVGSSTAPILETDAGGWTAVEVGTSQTATNSNCTVYGSGSSITRSGNDLSLTVDLEFKGQFSGMKHLIMAGSDKVGTIAGGTEMGTWLVPGIPGTSHAEVVSISAPNEIYAGESFTGTVRMRNTGQNYWQASWINPQQPHRLGSQNPGDNTRWGLQRVDLPDEVLPGAETTFQFTATAPTVPGTYPFDWRMVHDAVEWFGATATKTIAVLNTNPYPESLHPYPTYCDETWWYTHPGNPQSINVTFDSRTNVVYGYDWIHVMDGNGTEVPGSPFTGGALAGATLAVPGSSVRIRLVALHDYTDWGFAVTSVTAGPSAPGPGFYDDPDPLITYSGDWHLDYGFPETINGSITYTPTAGAAATFTFLGRAVTYYFTKAFNRGYADVYIDGSFRGRIDLYSSGIEWQSSYTFSGLTYAIHTIRIVVTGEKRAESEGAFVDLDGFRVLNP